MCRQVRAMPMSIIGMMGQCFLVALCENCQFLVMVVRDLGM